jgi:hypothetical protein
VGGCGGGRGSSGSTVSRPEEPGERVAARATPDDAGGVEVAKANHCERCERTPSQFWFVPQASYDSFNSVPCPSLNNQQLRSHSTSWVTSRYLTNTVKALFIDNPSCKQPRTCGV